MKKNLSIVDIIGIIAAVIILLFIVVPGVIGVGITILIKLIYLGVYLIVGWVMLKIIEHCLKEKGVK